MTIQSSFDTLISKPSKPVKNHVMALFGNNKPVSDLKNPDYKFKISKLFLNSCPSSFPHPELSQSGSTLCSEKYFHAGFFWTVSLSDAVFITNNF